MGLLAKLTMQTKSEALLTRMLATPDVEHNQDRYCWNVSDARMVAKFVVTIIVAALAVGVIAASRSPKPKPSQIVEANGLDDLGQQHRLDDLMICADASHACPGPYIPVDVGEVVEDRQREAGKWPPEPTPSKIIKARWGEFDLQRSFTIDPVELLLVLAERASLVRNGGSL